MSFVQFGFRTRRNRLVLIAAVVSLAFAGIAWAQTQPGTAVPNAPFEVHGMLYSGSAPAGFLLGDAWAQGATFRGVLDADGNPAVDDEGIPFRASRLVDGNWGNQGMGIDDSIFAGGNKNDDLIGPLEDPWEWKTGSSGPQKNDITNAYFHTRVDPLTGDRWVFVAAETRSTSGDSHVDFEFNQAGVLQTGTTGGTLIGLGPHGGRTIDDFLISVDFADGGEAPVATLRFWNGGNFELASFPGAIFSASNFVDIPHGSEGSWKHFAGDGTEVEVLSRLQLVEVGANLTTLGLDVNPCATEATLVVKTRSSSSWTSDLKDFTIVRFPLEPVPELVFSGPERVCSGDTFEVEVQETTGLRNSALSWDIAGCGAIISDPTAKVITVQADDECNCDIELTAAISGGECLHHVTESVTVLVANDAVPTFGAEPDDLTVECDAIPEAPSLTASDECSEVTLELTEVTHPGVCNGDEILVRTWTASDECGNQSVFEQFLTVEDTTPPALSELPPDEVVACNAIPDPTEVTATDNCSEASVTFDESLAPGSCVGSATITRTWTAVDSCGNEASGHQVLTVVDETPPELASVPENATVECDDIPGPAVVTVTDDCSDPVLGFDEQIADGECFGNAAITRTWTATDNCGNATSDSQVLTVVDTTPPVLHGVPADQSAECDDVPDPPLVTADDNCAETQVEFEETVEPGETEGTAVITRTWTATDDCGNRTSQSQTIMVMDSTGPVLEDAPEDMTVECDAVPDPAAVSTNDNCGEADIDFEESVEPGSCEGETIITRTWTATDPSGNQSSHTQTITVVDRTSPILSEVPEDQTVDCHDIPEPAAVSATDSCSAVDVELIETTEPGECTGSYTLTRTWTATDACGNQATHTQVITVVDHEAPILSDDPADVTAECDAVPDAQVLSALDACDPEAAVEFDEIFHPGDCPTEYTLDRLWSTADDCGNTEEVTQVVTVVDTTPPVIQLGPKETQYICNGQPVAFNAFATDNCGDATVGLVDLIAITAHNKVEVLATPQADGSYSITATGPALVMGTITSSDGCQNVSDDFDFAVFARVGGEACSQGFWKNHPELWEQSGFSPSDLFLEAFQITDLSSPEIPSNFDPNLTLWDAINNTAGTFNQVLVHGTGALLNAAHPDMEFQATVASIRLVMQAAFAGAITFDEARTIFGIWNGVEGQCGCPVQ